MLGMDAEHNDSTITFLMDALNSQPDLNFSEHKEKQDEKKEKKRRQSKTLTWIDRIFCDG